MSAQGTYALLLHLDTPCTVLVGALGTLEMPPGWYLYIGSAHGHGGLQARLNRHRRRTGKRFHWHIDYVRVVLCLVQVWTNASRTRHECDWASAASALPGARIIAPRFGASDCHCPSHLFHYVHQPVRAAFESLIQTALECQSVDEVIGCF